MSSEQLASIAGIVLSLALSYIPGLSAWYNALVSQRKAAFMALLLVLVTAGTLAYQCRADLAGCASANWETYLSALVAALVANQAVYLITRPFKKF